MYGTRRKSSAALAVAVLSVGLVSAAIELSTPVPAAAAATAGPGTYVAVTATRMLDTRIGLGAPAARVAAHGSISFAVTSRAGIPTSSAVSAVAVNLTVTNTAAGGYLSAYPAGAPSPGTSALNFAAAETRAHSVVVAPGVGGKVTVHNASGGALDLLADVEGYYTAGAPTGGGEFGVVTSARVLDTRLGVGAPQAPLTRVDPLAVQLTGRGGIPATDVSAVMLNLTVTQPTSGGYLDATDFGGFSTGTSVNFSAGQTVSNLVVVPLSNTGTMILIADLAADSGTVQVVADVSGYFRSGSPSAGGRLGSLNPTRLLDTRFGTVHELSPHATLSLAVAGQPDIPTGITAAVLNVAVPAPSGSGHITAYPSGTSLPATSSVSFSGHTVSNLLVVPVGSDGRIRLYNSSTHLINLVVDISGFFGPIPGPLSWSGRTAFPPEPHTTAPDGGFIEAVSCASATFCGAVDIDGAALFYNGTTWSIPQPVTTAGLNAISCPQSGFCVALGQGAFVYSGGTWVHMSLPGSPASLHAITCQAISFCLAVDQSDETHAWVFDGTTWTRTDTGIPQSDDGDDDNYGIGSIACASAAMCVASAADGPTARFNGSTWTMLSGPGIPLGSISCPATTRCVGVAGNDAVTFDGSHWGALVALAPVRVYMAGVSCASITSCVGVTLDGEMQFYNGTTWTAPVVLDDNGFRYVSCPTTTFCVASGYEDSLTASG